MQIDKRLNSIQASINKISKSVDTNSGVKDTKLDNTLDETETSLKYFSF
jgi:hypothetical protein